jgi:hypothetical protein
VTDVIIPILIVFWPAHKVAPARIANAAKIFDRIRAPRR